MDNRICQISVHDRSLSPAQAEVWITVVPERQAPTTEVRGRLMGPRCLYSSTVEIAYPLRPLSPSQKSGGPTGLSLRAIVPEASLWEPPCPFLYQGPIELWQDGKFCDRAVLSHGLRSLGLTNRGLCVNGRPLTLRGRRLAACSEEEAFELHQAGFNLFLAPVGETSLHLWELADRLGFFLLGQVTENTEETVRRLEQLSAHASCLGWVIDDAVHPPLDCFPTGCLLGLAGVSVSLTDLPERVHFVVGQSELANIGKPLLVQGDEPLPWIEGRLTLGSVL